MSEQRDLENLKKAKALIKAHRYDEAKTLLMRTYHPTAMKWLQKIQELEEEDADEMAELFQRPKAPKRATASFASYPAEKPKNRARPQAPVVRSRNTMHHILRWFWGLLVLGSCCWIPIGMAIAGTMIQTIDEEVAAMPIDSPYAAESNALAGDFTKLLTVPTTMAFVLCTAIPVFFFSAILYWRNGIAIRKEIHHTETIHTMQSRRDDWY